jgi:hypothetical protein
MLLIASECHQGHHPGYHHYSNPLRCYQKEVHCAAPEPRSIQLYNIWKQQPTVSSILCHQAKELVTAPDTSMAVTLPPGLQKLCASVHWLNIEMNKSAAGSTQLSYLMI